ncbi:hypothetical protein J6590_065468 [Homalodisca vitripennis]|nr:hypothetical protein J6590_065468 [Homalodisca vitripennis]
MIILSLFVCVMCSSECRSSHHPAIWAHVCPVNPRRERSPVPNPTPPLNSRHAYSAQR